MTRLEGWDLLLSAFLLSRADTPFEWGVNDCALFAADAVLAITGTDIAASYRGYTTAEEAQDILDAHGGLQGLATTGFGFEPSENPLMAQRGDAVLMMLNGNLTCGIVDDSGQNIACVSEADGLTHLPLIEALEIWSY